MKWSKSNWFSTFDLLKAYHQCRVAPESIQYTAWIYEFVHFENPCMQQGIKTASAWFERKVDKILNKLMIRNTVVPFMDDIVLLHTRTRNQHRD